LVFAVRLEAPAVCSVTEAPAVRPVTEPPTVYEFEELLLGEELLDEPPDPDPPPQPARPIAAAMSAHGTRPVAQCLFFVNFKDPSDSPSLIKL